MVNIYFYAHHTGLSGDRPWHWYARKAKRNTE
ncbi:hypothetical protein SAMN04488128_103746 [Chitinophaga eiseniae]|uniref:Uncharacterized protein n=1 Tax=Chitinophaga eiseniae TaxID=634771 RepID=A0A1T4SXW2_9BACT|nr:hypothetical protein SAMN04488128_103746 [Chitinophaga eiseniae]